MRGEAQKQIHNRTDLLVGAKDGKLRYQGRVSSTESENRTGTGALQASFGLSTGKFASRSGAESNARVVSPEIAPLDQGKRSRRLNCLSNTWQSRENSNPLYCVDGRNHDQF